MFQFRKKTTLFYIKANLNTLWNWMQNVCEIFGDKVSDVKNISSWTLSLCGFATDGMTHSFPVAPYTIQREGILTIIPQSCLTTQLWNKSLNSNLLVLRSSQNAQVRRCNLAWVQGSLDQWCGSHCAKYPGDTKWLRKCGKVQQSLSLTSGGLGKMPSAELTTCKQITPFINTLSPIP